MFSPGREPIEPFVVTAVDRPFRDHRAQELHLPFHSRNRLRKNGDDVFGCLVRIVRSGHRTASQQPLHTPAWVCAGGHGPKIVGQFKTWILLANSPKQNPCGKFCSHHGARLNKNRTFALSRSTIMHSTGCICLLVVISPAVSAGFRTGRRTMPENGRFRTGPPLAAEGHGRTAQDGPAKPARSPRKHDPGPGGGGGGRKRPDALPWAP